MSFQKEIDQAIKEKRLYFVGDSLPSDWYAGFKAWLQAAEGGNAKAQYNVGRCYGRGDGVDKDEDQAKYWYIKASEQNDPRAFFNLHLLHEDDASKYRDATLAEEFLTEAARLGEERAIAKLKNKRISDLRDDFQAVNETAAKKLKELIDSRNIDDARKFLESINDERIVWLKEYLPYLYLEVDPEYKFVSKKTKADETWVKGGVVNGTTNWYKRLVYETRYSVVANVRNNSDKVFWGIGPGESKTSEWYSSASGFDLSFENFKHPDYEVRNHGKCDPYKPFDAYYWMEIDSVLCWYSKPTISIPFEKPILVAPKKTETDSTSGCFVLTACYGDENHPIVQGFRDFRDIYLTKTKFGRSFIDFYYKYGPLAAKAVEKRRLAKSVLRSIFRVINLILPKCS